MKERDTQIDEMIRNCTQNVDDDNPFNPPQNRSKNNLQSGIAAAERFLAAVAKDMFFNDANFFNFFDFGRFIWET